jgi:hypothetical protein
MSLSAPQTRDVVKLVHRPPHAHCKTPMILGVGASYEVIHCAIFLLRLKIKEAITTTQCHSGQWMSYMYSYILFHNLTGLLQLYR